MTINQGAIFDSFLLLTILAILLERALALLFEQKYIAPKLKDKGLKDIIAFAVCFIVCKTWSIDVISLMLSASTTATLGFILTAAAIAGGSKASITLFQDIIGIGKTRREVDLPPKQEVVPTLLNPVISSTPITKTKP